MSFTSWARIWIDPSLWTFWLISASATRNRVANWTRKIQRKQVGIFYVSRIIQKSFILFLSTTNLHISHFPFLAFRTEIELLEKWTFPFLTRWLWLFQLSISENHSQLLRPSYTPKSNDYGIDRVMVVSFLINNFQFCFSFKPKLNFLSCQISAWKLIDIFMKLR